MGGPGDAQTPPVLADLDKRCDVARVTAEGIWCPKCGQTKTLEDFHHKRNGRPVAYCKACYKELNAARYKADPEHYRSQSSEWAKANRPKINERRQRRRSDPEYAKRERERDRARHPDRWIRTHYKLTREEWDALLEAQGGGCAICGATEPGGLGRFHVDHDHSCCPGNYSCGRCVRGILCNACNPMIGHGRDNPIILRKAAEYLERRLAH